MCGKEHTGDYYVCNACITEYNLTEEQIMEMGGKRDKFEINNSVSPIETDQSVKKMSEPKPIVKENENVHTQQESQVQQKNMTTQTQNNSDPYLIMLRRIDSNLYTIKTIIVILFTLFLIGVFIGLIGMASLLD